MWGTHELRLKRFPLAAFFSAELQRCGGLDTRHDQVTTAQDKPSTLKLSDSIPLP
jgi:hypothetical protein